MRCLHLHVSVPNIEQAVAFYTALFDAPPSVLKTDYAKWMLVPTIFGSRVVIQAMDEDRPLRERDYAFDRRASCS
jgi:hypothetical protein